MGQMSDGYRRLAAAVLRQAVIDWRHSPFGVGSDVPAFLLSELGEVYLALVGTYINQRKRGLIRGMNKKELVECINLPKISDSSKK